MKMTMEKLNYHMLIGDTFPKRKKNETDTLL